MKLITLTKSRYKEEANETVVVNIDNINYMRSEFGDINTAIHLNGDIVFVNEPIEEVLIKIAEAVEK